MQQYLPLHLISVPRGQTSGRCASLDRLPAARDAAWRGRLGGTGFRRCGSSRPTAQADLPGEHRALCGIGRRHHRIVPGQPPAAPIVLGCHVVPSGQMPLEHLEFLAVFQADDEILLNRLLDWQVDGDLDVVLISPVQLGAVRPAADATTLLGIEAAAAAWRWISALALRRTRIVERLFRDRQLLGLLEGEAEGWLPWDGRGCARSMWPSSPGGGAGGAGVRELRRRAAARRRLVARVLLAIGTRSSALMEPWKTEEGLRGGVAVSTKLGPLVLANVGPLSGQLGPFAGWAVWNEARRASAGGPTQRCAAQMMPRVPARVLRKRNDSLPVSMMCARSVSRSTSA